MRDMSADRRAERMAQRTPWQRLCDDHAILGLASGWPLHEPMPPRPLSPRQVARIVATLHDARYGPLLEDVPIRPHRGARSDRGGGRSGTAR